MKPEKHSFRSLRNSGDAKIKDLYRVRYDKLVVVPGNNERDAGPRLDAHREKLLAFMRNGGKVPALEVQVNPQTGDVEIVQGHSRHHAYGILIPERQEKLRAMKTGNPETDEKIDQKIEELEFIDCIPFEGNDLEKRARIASGNNGLPHTEVELARLYKSMKAEFDLTVEELALLVGEVPAHVKLHLDLGSTDVAVQKAVSEGKVSATVATKLAKAHGKDTAKVIAEEVKKAEAKGKKKVTAGTMKGKSLPSNMVSSFVGRVKSFRDNLPDTATNTLDQFENGELDAEDYVSVPVGQLHSLLIELKVVEDKQNGVKPKTATPPPADDDDEI